MIIINWAVYNHGFFQRAFFGKQKEVTLFHERLLACADGQGRGGDYFVSFFCLVSPGQGGNSSCTTWTPECPPPHCVAGGPGRLIQAFRTRPGGDSLAAAPSSAPPRSPQREACRRVVVCRDWGAHPRQDGCDWDMETVTSVLVPWPSRPRCVLAA